jgi:tyrosyl-tRNA synthetase
VKKLIVVNNADWYSEFKFVDFISEFGRHFRLGQMLSRQSVKDRLDGEGISFTEFSYQVFQAYDWLHLLKKYNCCFQLGGSDQMGNIMTGHELISRCDKREVFGLTLPIITNEEGDKFGKSAGNAVWLDSKKTSEFGFYQFFIRLSDLDAEKLLKLFSFSNYNETLQLIEKHKRAPELREAQKELATQLTLLIHGEEGLKRAQKLSDALYSGNVHALGELKPEEVSQLFTGCSYNELVMEPGMTILKAAMTIKCFLTERDAQRIISAGGFYINQQRVKNPQEMLTQGVHVWPNGVTLFRVGKKNYHVVRWHL